VIDTGQRLVHPIAPGLAPIVDAIRAQAIDLGMTQVRVGVAKPTTWVEVAGRTADGAWLALRLHHRPTQHRIQAGVLASQPLARGGGTTVIGDVTRTYRSGPQEVTPDVIREIRGWLASLNHLPSRPGP
jgi:hypothetical protein